MISSDSAMKARERLIQENELPALPNDWRVMRFRFLFAQSNERNGLEPVGNMLSVSEYRGVVPREYDHEEQQRSDEELTTYRVVRRGQLAVNTMWLNHLGLGVSEHLGHVSPAYAVYNISKDLDGRYVHHLLRSQFYLKIYLRYLYGIRPNSFQIKSDDWNSIPIIVPPLNTQKALAGFLDAETARIDALIEKKQGLAHAVELRVEALRDAAVVKGLDPCVSNRPSGVPWFGDVPEHWCVCRFNRLIASKVDYRGRTPEKVDDGVFLVTARNVRKGIIDYERSLEFTTEEDWKAISSRGRPEVGDVIFTTEAPLGQIAQVDRTDVAFAQRIIKFRADPSMVSNDFLAEFMMSSSFQRSLQIFASGSTAAGIKSERFAHLFGLVPPGREQDEIVAYIRAEVSRSRRLLQPLQKSIDVLREYRAALITAAVTGEIDLAGWRRRGEGDRHLERIEAEMTV